MITYDHPKLMQRTWVLALVLGGGVGVAAWWWQTHGATEPLPQASAPPAAPVAVAAASPVPQAGTGDSALLKAPTIMPDGRPSDFSPEDWAALKEAMSKTANPRSELARVVKYLRFQKGFEQWQSLQDSPDVAKRHKLAQRLLAQIPERLAQAEVTMGEALMLESALWTDLEPDEALRKQRMAQAQAALGAAAPGPDAQQQARDEALLKEYKRRESAILADYQSRPEAQRDQAKLARDLEAARVSVYGSQN